MINSLQAYWPQGVAIPLGQGQVFNIAMIGGAPYLMGSQSLWVRDRFLMCLHRYVSRAHVSQSLWVRDRFLITLRRQQKPRQNVAIPLGQGQVFNEAKRKPGDCQPVAIPLGQGQVFN